MRTLFNHKSAVKPNLSGKATLVVDCGYLRKAVLKWWIETKGNLLGTMVRSLKFNPFTFGKDSEKQANDVNKPQNISPESFRLPGDNANVRGQPRPASKA